MNAEQIAEIRGRLKAITIWPWIRTHYAGGRNFDGPPSVASSCINPEFGEPVKVAECNSEDDAVFIAHAPADLRALLEHVAQLESENAALYGFLGELTALTPVNSRLGKDAANLALADVGRRIRARLGT